MKNILFTVIFTLLLVIKLAFANGDENLSYDQIYNSLPVIEINYLENEDPDESYDYSQYVGSPYPLIRTTSNLKNKNSTIPAGYYLLKPANINGHNVVLFKQTGKIIASVPVFEKHIINPDMVYPKPPKPKKNPFLGPFRVMKSGFQHLFGQYKKPPQPPRCAMESFTSNDGKYFVMWLYQEEYVYKMVFLIVR